MHVACNASLGVFGVCPWSGELHAADQRTPHVALHFPSRRTVSAPPPTASLSHSHQWSFVGIPADVILPVPTGHPTVNLALRVVCFGGFSSGGGQLLDPKILRVLIRARQQQQQDPPPVDRTSRTAVGSTTLPNPVLPPRNSSMNSRSESARVEEMYATVDEPQYDQRTMPTFKNAPSFRVPGRPPSTFVERTGGGMPDSMYAEPADALGESMYQEPLDAINGYGNDNLYGITSDFVPTRPAAADADDDGPPPPRPPPMASAAGTSSGGGGGNDVYDQVPDWLKHGVGQVGEGAYDARTLPTFKGDGQADGGGGGGGLTAADMAFKLTEEYRVIQGEPEPEPPSTGPTCLMRVYISKRDYVRRLSAFFRLSRFYSHLSRFVILLSFCAAAPFEGRTLLRLDRARLQDARHLTALCRTQASTDDDELSFGGNENILIAREDEDGWWLGIRELTGEVGYVPNTFLSAEPVREYRQAVPAELVGLEMGDGDGERGGGARRRRRMGSGRMWTAKKSRPKQQHPHHRPELLRLTRTLRLPRPAEHQHQRLRRCQQPS